MSKRNKNMQDTSYSVGYGKPPQKSRFKPGQSGNPKGRPKGSLNYQTMLMNALNSTILIRENGKTRPISKLEAGTIQMANKVAQGDLRALKMLASDFLERGHQETKEAVTSSFKVPEEQKHFLIESLRMRLATLVADADSNAPQTEPSVTKDELQEKGHAD
jgi:hypothetical protein